MENRIKEFRKKMGVTQEQLAKAIDVSRQTVISLERDKPIPSIIQAYKIAEFFDVKIEDIFTLAEATEEEMESLNRREKLML